MEDESKLKIECAKLQANIKLMEDDLSQLENSQSRAVATSQAGRTQLIEREKRQFLAKQENDRKQVHEACLDMATRVEDLLDSFPEMETKEYAGKYEIKSIEASLEELYPRELLQEYICSNPIVFSSEGQAYAAYLQVERDVTRLSNGSVAGSLFTRITEILDRICTSDDRVGKIALGFAALFMLSFFFFPFAFLTVFSVVGLSAVVQGRLVNAVFRKLYSVKQFLNNVYDEDIFQEDKQDIMGTVEDFLEKVEQDYLADIDEQEFVMSPKLLEDYDRKAQEDKSNLEARILAKRQALEDSRKQAQELLAQLDEAIKVREGQAKEAYTKFLDTIEWKREWIPSVLLDITQEKRVLVCRWLKGNTLYFGKSIDNIQQFQQLAVYQNLIKMHPTYAGQVLIDYKYMGGRLVPFGRLKTVIIQLCYNPDDITKKMESIRTGIRARIDTILQSCESIEDFNALMGTYGVSGENYVTVHMSGLTSISPELKMMLKNGPRVGYFFKIYATDEEFSMYADDFPYDDVPEYAEVTESIVPRTLTQVKRRFQKSS